MSLTNFPNGIFATPNLGSDGSYAGLFGTTVKYVDGDLGSDANDGSADAPYKTIQKGITTSSARGTVYIKALEPDSDASDPGQYEEDLTIPFAKYGLRLIGVGSSGTKLPYDGPKIKNATATALLTVNAPGVHLENLQFNCTRNSGTYGVKLMGVSGYATLAGSCGATIVNCYFKNGSGTYGALYIYGGYGCYVGNCTFHNPSADGLGIILDSNTIPSNGHTIQGCDFKSRNGAVASLHLKIYGAVKDFNIDHCNFDQATKFITMIDGCSGVISHCTFNDASTTTAANSTGKIEIPAALDEVGVVGCYGGGDALIAQNGA